MSDSWAKQQRTHDALQPDRFPTCPRCGDLCDPGALICLCGCRLIANRGELARLRALKRPRIVPSPNL